MEMKWVYWGKLYNTKFQASCILKRIEHDAWVYGYQDPSEIEIFRSRTGRYGIRFTN
ncbi:hypothetical protein [Paenibacillus selenitireducens]|uniref:hypothetical protein n=1 Tax=Paenibacillus selenitireducens TaxID=1324314 RepID=UPI001301F040|nr:hypothetical protein [Paenibacillus selenitireducens]